MLISATALKDRLRSGLPTVIADCRHDLMDKQAGRRAFEAGHIAGARFVDVETQLSGEKTGSNGRHPLPGKQEFQQGLARLLAESGPQSLLVAYDDHGGLYALRLWWMARWAGFDQVALLDGGLRHWQQLGGEIAAGPAAAPVTHAASAMTSMLSSMPAVSAQFVLDNLQGGDHVVVDARAAARYRGETEPIDPVAGHIPGALNRVMSENLQEDGRFKSGEQLRSEFELLLGDRPPHTVIHQCGSGITACHNLFAMELAGLAGSKLYPGSWSEWVADPQRPVARSD